MHLLELSLSISPRVALFCVVLSAFGFAMKAIFVKLAYQYGITAIPLLFLRMLFAFPFFTLMLLLAAPAPRPITPKRYAIVVFAGLLGYYAASLFDFIGLQYISASLERLILFLYPTLTVLLGVFFHKERLSPAVIGGIVSSYVGIALVFVPDLHHQQKDLWLGGFFVFASTLCYAIYLTVSGQLVKSLGSARFTALVMLVSCAGVLLHFSLSQPVSLLWHWPLPVYAYAVLMAIASTVLPAWLLAVGMKHMGASRTALVSTLGPVLTLILGWLILDERLNALQWLGGGVVIASVVWVGRAQKSPVVVANPNKSQ